MWKKFFFALLLFCFMPSRMLGAEDEYAITVPDTWTVTHNGSSSIYTHPKETCAINISVAPHQGTSLQDLGVVFYENFSGTEAKADDNGLTFRMKHKKLPIIMRLTIQNENYMLVSASGTCPKLQDILKTIIVKNEGARPYPLLNYYAKKPKSS